MTEGRVWRVTLHRRAAKELERLPKQSVNRVWTVLEGLETNPYPRQANPVKGSEDTHRIRISSYRVVYHVDDERITVLVLRIGHRRDVYRDL